MRITRAWPFVVALLALGAASPALAQDHSFRVFATANWISPLGEEDVTFGSVTDSIQGATEVGYEAGFEWRLNKLLGLEGSYMFAQQDVEFGGDTIGNFDQSSVTAAFNFHILPTKIFDLWVAPVASWVDASEVELDSSVGGGTTSIESAWAYGAALGFDIGFGKTFAITGGVRWLNLDASTDNPAVEDLTVDPLIARAGIAFRFGTR